ncbi:hypothetical protein [Burkholderia sp. MSMB1072]|uniref:hypothetical protein n=1 Tax=Burkholderia sp. MSMB1072 TaxID=1637871 RepID=UPI00211D5009|nr:hypothetical protein [Burkholderia sp. MSMB1072]
MTDNQSFIEEIEMNNCAGKSLKFFADLPLTGGRHMQHGHGARCIAAIADIHRFIHAPRNPFY